MSQGAGGESRIPIEAQRILTDDDFKRMASLRSGLRDNDHPDGGASRFSRVDSEALLGDRKRRVSKEEQKRMKLETRREQRSSLGSLGRRRKVVRNADRRKTKPLPMVWDKLQRQKKKEMDTPYSKRRARKQFRGHFHKARRK